MIEIIKPKPKKYIMKCFRCDCVFTYDLEDIVETDVLHLNQVECPECHSFIEHYNRLKEVLQDE